MACAWGGRDVALSAVRVKQGGKALAKSRSIKRAHPARSDSPSGFPLALLADIHANLEALEAVLADADALGVRRFACLGDLVGYGADPEAVLDLLMKREVIAVAGNHEIAVASEATRFNPIAKEAVQYTRKKLHPGASPRKGVRLKRWEFVKNIPPVLTEGNLQFVHGSLREPIEEYVYGPREDLHDPEQLEDLFPLVRWCCFFGHTHRPVVLREDGEHWYPEEREDTRVLDRARKHLINPGSVGQPRDGDARACYAIFDGKSLRYRRLEYDVKSAVRKIKEIGAHSRRLAARLLVGV